LVDAANEIVFPFSPTTINTIREGFARYLFFTGKWGIQINLLKVMAIELTI
jgi:hypothetical protein